MKYKIPDIIKPKPTIFTIAFALCAFCGLYAQTGRVVLSGKNLTASEIFSQIREQTPYRVAYDRSVFDASRIVDIADTNTDIETILSRVTAGQSVEYRLQGNLIVIAPKRRPLVTILPAVSLQQTEDRDMQAGDPEPLPVLDPNPIAEMPVALPARSFFTELAPRQHTFVTTYASRIAESNPRYAIKSNLLYLGATFSPNMAFETALGSRATIDLRIGYNWIGRKSAASDHHRQRLHFLISPEYRWWMCERFNGHFIGGHIIYSRYNVSGHDIPLMFKKEYRYDGHAFGAGVSYGYHLPFARRWGVEFNAGAGYMAMNYEKFTCAKCDKDAETRNKHYFGPTRAGVSLVFMIK